MNEWVCFGSVDQFPTEKGRSIRWRQHQIAVFNFEQADWYAIDNSCPHWDQTVLYRGPLKESDGQRTVVCPLHNVPFDLATGEHCGGNKAWHLNRYDVKVTDGQVYLLLPSEESAVLHKRYAK